jgi:acyl dehydratase
MKLPSAIVGTTAGPFEQDIDARWLMAYAAALGETASEYFDTTRPEGIVPHPLFPVCYEWPLAQALRAKTLGDEIAARGVHATHDLTLHRPPRPGDRLRTTATITAVDARGPGAYVLTRFETVDAEGQPVSTTEYGSLYRGVECEGAPVQGTGRGEESSAPDWSATIPIAPTLAHIYSECARIWNPIHTDRAAARAAGLPDIILHGTATLALAVSEILRRQPTHPAAPVTRIACRFSAMVPLPSTITVRGRASIRTAIGQTMSFEVLNMDGRVAVKQGRVLQAGSVQRTLP